MTTEHQGRWRSTRTESNLIKEAAIHFKVSDRSVREWRKVNDPRWQRFIANRGSLGQLEACSLRTDLEKPGDPIQEEKSALRRFRMMESEIEKALDCGQLGSIPTISRAASDCHKLLMQTRQAAMDWNVQMKKYIPAAEVTALLCRYVTPLKQVLNNLPHECAILCNPSDPSLAGAALREWLEGRFNVLLDEAQDAIGDAVSPHQSREEE